MGPLRLTGVAHCYHVRARLLPIGRLWRSCPMRVLLTGTPVHNHLREVGGAFVANDRVAERSGLVV